MTVSCQLVLQSLRSFVPPRFAMERDPTGLQVGSADKQVARVLCTLDLTLEVAEEARRIGAGLIVSHHAVIYRPLTDLRTDRARGRILEQLIKGDIAVYVPHTALDVADGGLNDRLADAIGLSQRGFLSETGRDPAQLVRAFADDENAAELARLARKAGALAVERRGDQVEAVVAERKAARLAERWAARSGAEPQRWALGSHASPRGIGRVGRLAEPTPIRQLAAQLKGALGAPGVRVVASDLERSVHKVAVVCGDGRRFIDAALFSGADALVTGDIDHHSALDARARGLALIDVGHGPSERFAGEILAAALRARLDGQPVEIVASDVDTQPFSFL